MANFTEQEANACVINRCESVKIDGIHQYWVFAVCDTENNLYELQDNGCAGDATDAALKTCIKDFLMTVEKMPARQVITNDTKDVLIGSTIG